MQWHHTTSSAGEKWKQGECGQLEDRRMQRDINRKEKVINSEAAKRINVRRRAMLFEEMKGNAKRVKTAD